jgi:hypothetical protein
MGRGDLHIGFLVDNPESKRQLGRPRYRWENNIKKESWEGFDLIDLV